MYQNLYLCRGVIVYFTDFYFSLFHRFQNRIYQRGGGFTIRNLCNGKCFIIQLGDFSAYFHYATPFSVVVFRYVDGTSGLEVGIELKRFIVQVGDGCIAQFVKVMR